jgi:electron transport complex protein RnfD
VKLSAIAGKSPSAPARSVRRIMAMVLLALIPGIAVGTALFGLGVLAEISLALTFALLFEASLLKLRKQPLVPFLTDLSAPLTAVLFALLIPPSAPWWLAMTGMAVAIIFAKHSYGGLGHNLFNPAMAGLAAVRLCFPHEFAQGLPISALATSANPTAVPPGTSWLAIAYALGGIFLLWKKIVPWQTPLAALSATVFLGVAWQFHEPNSNHLLLQTIFPAVMVLAAFFITTDPVTGCISARGRLLFGAGVGVLGTLIGHWRGDSFGLALAVLLMNCLVPWIDRRTLVKIRRPAPTRMDSNA